MSNTENFTEISRRFHEGFTKVLLGKFWREKFRISFRVFYKVK